MNEKWMSYENVLDVYTDYFISDSNMTLNLGDDMHHTLRNLIRDYDNITMDDWFEDEPIVEKKIPEFNFVK